MLEKLVKFMGKNVRNVVEREDEKYCFRLHRNRVYYVREELVRRATNVRGPSHAVLRAVIVDHISDQCGHTTRIRLGAKSDCLCVACFDGRSGAPHACTRPHTPLSGADVLVAPPAGAFKLALVMPPHVTCVRPCPIKAPHFP